VTDRSDLENDIRRAVDPLKLMQRVADEALTIEDSVEGVFVGLTEAAGWLTLECAAGSLKQQAGSRVPLRGGLVGLALATGESFNCYDAENDPRVERDLCHLFSVVSMVCVPLRRLTETVGVLCVTSSRPWAFDESDVAVFERLAEFISAVIAVAVELAGVTDEILTRNRRDANKQRFVANVVNPAVMTRFETRTRVERFLTRRGLSHVFQPIFDLSNGECFAVEALARFSGRPKQSPEDWFGEAYGSGVGVELEAASVESALGSLPRLADTTALCINVGPQAIVSEQVQQLLAASESRRIIVELTEDAKVDDYLGLSDAIKRLRHIDVRLSIDDTGAGFSSFAHILKLAPDIIKLDRELTLGIDHDPVRAALGTALVSFSTRVGAEIVAEGIETRAELETLHNLGVRYAQGYFLCRPKPLEMVPSRLRKGIWSPATRAS
jgi:EAL domain-containing protein (putative c-di-GMP-specific phosphodiesterase class I)/putative methionine-R-sulfoxide reductase with GAF domain